MGVAFVVDGQDAPKADGSAGAKAKLVMELVNSIPGDVTPDQPALEDIDAGPETDFPGSRYDGGVR